MSDVLTKVNEQIGKYTGELDGIKKMVTELMVDVPEDAENKLSLQGWNNQIEAIINKVDGLKNEVSNLMVTDDTIKDNPMLDFLFKMF